MIVGGAPRNLNTFSNFFLLLVVHYTHNIKCMLCIVAIVCTNVQLAVQNSKYHTLFPLLTAHIKGQLQFPSNTWSIAQENYGHPIYSYIRSPNDLRRTTRFNS